MKKILVIGLIASFFIPFFSSCERIDQGHAGLKIDIASDSKGTGIAEVSGWVFYMPGMSIVEEFPIYTQTADYDEFVVTTKDAAQFHVDPTLNYSVPRENAIRVYQQYRKPLDQLQVTILRNVVFDAYRITANRYTSDSIMSNRGNFERDVENELTNSLNADGFKFERITSNLTPPPSLQQMVNAKNQAIQEALKATNEVKTAEAQAKIKAATAEGNIAVAKADYEVAKLNAAANRELQSSYTENFVKMRWIEAWESGGAQVPQYMLGGNSQFLMQMK